MESLGDVLQRLAATREAQSGNGRANGFERPEPACALCQDLGWTTPDVPPGDPDFGRRIVCECQRESMERERHDRLVRYSNLANLTRSTFDTLDPRGRADDPESRDMFATALEAAQRFAENAEGWLLISGPNGSGKTHLAAAIANRIIERGRPALFVHVPDLLDHLRAAFSPQAQISYDDLFEQVRNAPLLVLDELGSHSATPWAEEKLRQIVNHRFNAELPTVVTTTARLDEIDPYLRARLADPQLSMTVRTRLDFDAWRRRWGEVDPEMLRSMTFDSFNVQGRKCNENQRDSLKNAKEFATSYSEYPDGWVTLSGPTGVGKTHLAVAIARVRMDAGDEVLFWRVPDLLDYLRSGYDSASAVSFIQLFDEVKAAKLLILDRLGDEASTEWGQEKIFQLIEHRYSARLPTVITTKQDFTLGRWRSNSGERNPKEGRQGKTSGVQDHSRRWWDVGSRVQDTIIGQILVMDANDYRVNRPGSGAGHRRQPQQRKS